MKSQSESFALWEERIADRNKSGMPVDKWCSINGIRKSQYYYWKKRIQNKQVKGNKETFIEVTSILSDYQQEVPDTSKTDDFQIHIKNLKVSVPSQFDALSLSRLLKVIQES